MKKKLFALCLALVLCLGMAAPAAATESAETLEEARKTVSVQTTMSDYQNRVEQDYTVYSKDWYDEDAEVLEEYQSMGAYRILGKNDEITITNCGEKDGNFLWVYVNACRKIDGKYVNLCDDGCCLRTTGEFVTQVVNLEDPTQQRVKLYGGESITIKVSDMLCNGPYTKQKNDPVGDLYLLTVCREYEDGTYWRTGTWAYMIDDEKAEAIKSEGNPFTDVPANAYYRDAVLWALENGVTAGTTKTTFGPVETCTREQVMTFLWRAMGKPEVETAHPFTDIKESDYSYQAILWAVKEGITAGTTTTTFGPKDTCTEAQVLTFLWRAFNDGGKPIPEGKPYYALAEEWAASLGLFELTGKAFSANSPSPRADIVTFIYEVVTSAANAN